MIVHKFSVYCLKHLTNNKCKIRIQLLENILWHILWRLFKPPSWKLTCNKFHIWKVYSWFKFIHQLFWSHLSTMFWKNHTKSRNWRYIFSAIIKTALTGNPLVVHICTYFWQMPAGVACLLPHKNGRSIYSSVYRIYTLGRYTYMY